MKKTLEAVCAANSFTETAASALLSNASRKKASLKSWKRIKKASALDVRTDRQTSIAFPA